MINVLYSSLVVCFGLMFPQTKYEYDLLLLRQNDSLYFIYTCILHYYRMFSIPFKCTLYLLYTSRGVFIWRINYYYCHTVTVIVESDFQEIIFDFKNLPAQTREWVDNATNIMIHLNNAHLRQ